MSGMNVPMPYGIYHDGKMVGFIMAVYQPIDPHDPEDTEDDYYLPRMMIDKRYQNRGFGKQALREMIDIMKTFPHGQADAAVLSCDKQNTIAIKLYLSLGFADTGKTDEDGDHHL